MTYTVSGTLYNRYVLQLRGFDQIPQFSIESMKYHAREAIDWIKDILAAYNVGGNGGGLPYASRTPAMNPVSHHTQASEEHNINTNTFVRPQTHLTRPSSQRDTNPVSHHTQTQIEEGRADPSLNSPPPPPPKTSLSQFVPRRVDLGSRGPTRQEREFLLGDEGDEGDEEYEDEDEGEELQDKPTSATPSLTPSNVGGSSTPDASTTLNHGDTNIAASRGRDTNEGKIRL